MKKLLIATDGFLPRWDGIASFLNEIIPRLQDDFDITIIAPDSGKLKQKYKAEIIRFKTLKLRLADNYYASFVNPFSMLREARKSDMVWVQCIGPIGIAGIIIAKLQGKPVAIYIHMLEWEVYARAQGTELLKLPINIITKFLSIILYNLCTVIIVPSLEHAELLNVMNVKSKKKVVHLGVDVNRYKPSDKKEAKMKFGIPADKFVIGYAGRLSLEKDLKTLYRAFVRLSRDHKDILLLIAGGGRPEIENMFSSKKNVILTGLKDNLAPYYQAMDVYVLPSLIETTSLTTMEAMASGCAVVSTPVGFVKEYLNDGQNGYFFAKQNSYDLAQKIEFIKQNDEIRELLGKAARKTIVENYNWDKTADNIREILDNLTAPLKNS